MDSLYVSVGVSENELLKGTLRSSRTVWKCEVGSMSNK